jgi:isocitrate/isopropylmalate dehydrogenase
MGFRVGFNLYAGVRPIKALRGSGALRPKADLIIVRENTEDLYKELETRPEGLSDEEANVGF